MGVPVVIGGDNLPSPVGIGSSELPNIGEPVAPLPPPPGSGITKLDWLSAMDLCMALINMYVSYRAQ